MQYLLVATKALLDFFIVMLRRSALRVSDGALSAQSAASLGFTEFIVISSSLSGEFTVVATSVFL